jgi:hypothetical protein
MKKSSADIAFCHYSSAAQDFSLPSDARISRHWMKSSSIRVLAPNRFWSRKPNFAVIIEKSLDAQDTSLADLAGDDSLENLEIIAGEEGAEAETPPVMKALTMPRSSSSSTKC